MAAIWPTSTPAFCKADSARRIDRAIDYFGGAGMEWLPLLTDSGSGPPMSSAADRGSISGTRAE